MEDNDFISFWENELWKMRSVLCRMSGIATQKRYCMAGKLLFLFPATLDRLRMASQVFSNKFIAVWLLTKILTCTVYNKKKNLFFLTTKSTKFHPFCHSSAGNRRTGKSVLRNLFLFLTAPKKIQKVSNISITAKYDNEINVTWQCNNYWRSYISLQLQM